MSDDPAIRLKTPREGARRRAIDVFEPVDPTPALVFASPHSGRNYPEDLIAATRLDPTQLRRSEDAYVDLLIEEAARASGTPFLKALFPRTYVDVNRDARELDPAMFEDALPADVDARSARVAAGLGAIARVVADGDPIYTTKLAFADARRRLQTCYAPYHASLQRLMDRAQARAGAVVVIDWHSMPSAGLPKRRGDAGEPDIVIGDRFGASAAAPCVDAVEAAFVGAGFSTVRNAPYAGGYVAQTYGRPFSGTHVVQIEINRRLYLDEQRVAPGRGFDAMQAALSRVVHAIADRIAEAAPALAMRLSAAE
ncbi:MAG: N-formylglutamate amidohydrolase [Pseudomonadota bacterium]